MGSAHNIQSKIPYVVVLEYQPTLNQHLSQVFDSDFVDTQMLLFNWDQLFRMVAPTIREMLVFCSWKEKSCMAEEFWETIITRNGACFQFTPPNRSVTLADERLNFIFGNF